MTAFPSNALLASPESDIETSSHSLHLADDVIAYSTTPRTVVRQLTADGIKPAGCMVYWAIADRQMSARGKYFRSNARLAEETGLAESTVRKWLGILKKNGYIHVWFDNGRKMRVVCKGHSGITQKIPEYHPKDTPVAPYQEDTTKKTTQPKIVCVFSEKHLSLFGARFLDGLVSSHGSDRVMSGLQVFDQQPDGTVRNLKAWLTDACKIGYEPSKKTAGKFTQCPFEHTKIIKEYTEKFPDKEGTIKAMISEGRTEGSIAYKIWVGKL